MFNANIYLKKINIVSIDSDMEGSSTVGIDEPLRTAMDEPLKSMNIMLGLDESDESFYALQWVLDNILKPTQTQVQLSSLGEEQQSKVLTIVNVVEPLPRYTFGHVTLAESASKSQQQNAAKVLSRAFQMCRDKSLNAKTLILEGDPKDTICRAADEMKIDLLVVGSRGLGQIKRAFLGSVSDYCANHAKCPVLVVKPPAKKTT